MITPTPYSFAGDGQSVDVIGQRDCNGILSEKCGWGDFGGGNVGGDLGGNTPGDFGGGGGGGGDFDLAQAQRFYTDTRCGLAQLPQTFSAYEYWNTLSTDDADKRKLAASAAQNLIFTSGIFRALVNQIWDHLRRGGRPIVTITFADGGSEQYYVGSVYGTLKVIDAVPGTWRQGTGKVEPSNCPRYG